MSHSDYIKIYGSDGNEVFFQRGGARYKFPRGTSVEVPFAGGNSITLAVYLSPPFIINSFVRLQYDILHKALGSG